MKTALQPRQEFLEHRPSKPDVESSSLSSPTTCGQSSDTPNISRSEGLGRTAFCTIPLTRGYVALVDAEDYARFGHLRWCAMPMQRSSGVYAHRGMWENGKKCRTILLHRAILDASPSQIVDHINGDTLDNRRSNLRITDRYGNARNRRVPVGTSGFTGVKPRGARWVGCVKTLGRLHYTKSFPSPVLAAAARDVLARQLHGEFAVLNFQFTPVSAQVLQ